MTDTNKQFLIGIAGVARVGKDTLAREIKKKLERRGWSSDIMSFATPLKEMSRDLFFKNFNIDVFNPTEEEKKIIRPVLVSLGAALRANTGGTFFIDQLLKKARLTKSEFIIIPDVRYAKFDNDEHTLFIDGRGFLVHLSRLKNGEIISPANDAEEENDPLLRAAAQLSLRQKTVEHDLIENYVSSYAEEVLTKIGL